MSGENKTEAENSYYISFSCPRVIILLSYPTKRYSSPPPKIQGFKQKYTDEEEHLPSDSSINWYVIQYIHPSA